VLKKNGFACLLFAQLLFGLGCGKAVEPDGEIIARVGDEFMTLATLKNDIPEHIRSDLSPAELREFVLRWINDQVLYQEAVARHVDKLTEVQHEISRLRAQILIGKLVEVALAETLHVSDAEIREYYDANQESFVLSGDLVRAYHALAHNMKEAKEIRKRLVGGEPFEEVVKSINPDSSHSAQWDLGYFSKSDVIPEIARVVFKMKVKSYSRPIKSDFGYHIIQLLDKQKKGDVKPFQAVKDEIRQKLLTSKRQERYERFLLQTKSKFEIETNFQMLGSALDSLMLAGE